MCAGMLTRGCGSWTKGQFDAIVLAEAGLRRLGVGGSYFAGVAVECDAAGRGAGWRWGSSAVRRMQRRWRFLHR